MSFVTGSTTLARAPGTPVDLPGLLAALCATGHLAEDASQEHYSIDPLKIDVARITQVMSYAFSKRHGILAMEVRPLETLIASAEPRLNSCEDELEHVIQKRIRRAVANPLKIKRLATQFYSIANSISAATRGGGRKLPGLGNLQQRLELGNIKDQEANDQSISDIHIGPRREQWTVRFRIDGEEVALRPFETLGLACCETGFKGRQEAWKKSVRSLRLCGAQKVAAGLTTGSEVLRVVGVGDS